MDQAHGAGTYYVLVKADYANAQVESDESNNWKASGPITIELPPLPDLLVAGVLAPERAWPYEMMELVWAITNGGTTNLNGIWQEAISLSTNKVLTNAVRIAAFTFTNSLAPGEFLLRTQWVSMPVDGPAGELEWLVEADSGQAVLESDEQNNIGWATNTVVVPLSVTLSPPTREFSERSSNSPIRALVYRNGPRTNDLLVSLASGDTSELIVPASVTIPTGASSASFDITVVGDGVVDGLQQVPLTATAPGMHEHTIIVMVEDADVPRLELSLESTTLLEGEQAVATVSRTSSTAEAVRVWIGVSGEVQRLSVPESVDILEGAESAVFSVVAEENTLVEGNRTGVVTVWAEGFEEANATVLVVDDDVPGLALSVLPGVMSERAGPLAGVGTVTRSFAGAHPLVVLLESSDPGEAVVPPAVVIPAGALGAQFAIGAVDDLDLDGPQVVTLGGVLTETVSGRPLAVGPGPKCWWPTMKGCASPCRLRPMFWWKGEQVRGG